MGYRIVFANQYIKQGDVFHLAKEYYRYIVKHPKKESRKDWQNLKNAAENIIVWHRMKSSYCEPVSETDYRDFLRFYTSLEVKDRNILFVPSRKSRRYLIRVNKIQEVILQNKLAITNFTQSIAIAMVTLRTTVRCC